MKRIDIADIQQSKKMIFHTQHMGVIVAAMNASLWINEKINEWLGEKTVADTLSQSVLNNITSERGMALLEVADVICPYATIIDYLQQIKDDNFLDDLIQFDGRQEVKNNLNLRLYIQPFTTKGKCAEIL